MRESATDVGGSDDFIDEKINTMIENLKSDPYLFKRPLK